MISNAMLFGFEDSHLDRLSLEKPLHREVVPFVVKLKEKAARAGFSLQVASGYRSFERQCAIWNGKARGDIPLLDADEQILCCSELSAEELMHAILRWSALPGLSRHHWGTDFDVFDGRAWTEGKTLELKVEHYAKGACFGSFNEWLASELKEKNSVFFRPYAQDRGGVACEPWHLSYRPLASAFLQQVREHDLKSHLEKIDLALKNTVLQHLPDIVQRYVKNICE